MNYQESAQKIAGYRKEIASLRQKMRDAQAVMEPEEVKDYAFTRPDGSKTSLSLLFGDKDTLLMIHNMGRGCSSCTLWADGFNGVYVHLANRAAFAVSSPDPPAVQREFAAERGWRFPMVSVEGTTFPQDMGYWGKGPRPGVSVFKRQGKKIVRVADTAFSPYDDFCSVWHFFDLLPEGAAGWRPQFAYAG